MAKMYVSLLKFNTQSEQAKSVAARKKAIEDALDETNKHVSGKMTLADINRPVHCIFAAPEYMFANPVAHGDHKAGDVRHLSEATKVSIEAWLEALSVKYPKILLFPGSIAWKKPLVRTFDDYSKAKSERASHAGLKEEDIRKKFNAKAVSRTDKARGAITQNVLDSNDVKFDDLVGFFSAAEKKLSGDITDFSKPPEYDGKEWWFWAWDGMFWFKTRDSSLAKRKLVHAAPTAQEKLVELGGAGTATMMARNTCLVYLNGKKLLKYNKAQDFHEVVDASKGTVYIPGQTKAHFQTADGLTYGMEICLDHESSSLKKKLNTSKIVPQVVVLLSAHVTMKPSKLANTDAMAIHACSLSQHNLVGKGGIDGANATKEINPEPAGYSIYSFDMP